MIHGDHISNLNYDIKPIYFGHLERTTQTLTGARLPRCDYFQTSLKIGGADICMVVGVIQGICVRFSPVITI